MFNFNPSRLDIHNRQERMETTISMAAGKTAQSINFYELSKAELLDLWYETDKELRNTNPFTNYDEWAVLQKRFNDIVEAYYKDWDGTISLEHEV